MQKMMTQDGKYTASFAAALTAASSVIGPIIPPSIPMVIYALVSDTSVGYLFLAASSRPAPRHRADGPCLARRQAKKFPVEIAVSLRDIPRIHVGGLPRADDAGGPFRLPLQRHHHAH